MFDTLQWPAFRYKVHGQYRDVLCVFFWTFYLSVILDCQRGFGGSFCLLFQSNGREIVYVTEKERLTQIYFLLLRVSDITNRTPEQDLPPSNDLLQDQFPGICILRYVSPACNTRFLQKIFSVI